LPAFLVPVQALQPVLRDKQKGCLELRYLVGASEILRQHQVAVVFLHGRGPGDESPDILVHFQLENN
jgi:hypothetical protein